MDFLLFANKRERKVILLCQKFSPDIVLTAALKHILSVPSLIWDNVENVIETKITKSQMAMISLVIYIAAFFFFSFLSLFFIFFLFPNSC